MDPEKFIQLQRQMQENNLEVENFLKEFDDWKDTVETKNKKLLNSSTSELPAVRNSLHKKHKKKTKVGNNLPKSDRIRSYDYQAWDKFDVDKALEEISSSDIEHQKTTSETDVELEDKRRINLSREARELGNIRFKEGKFEEAVEQYTLAIRLAPEDPIPYTNRAFAFLKMDQFASADADCSAALKLDPASVKALFRRAIARKSLHQINEAIQDLNTLLQLNPCNKAALDELNSIKGYDSSIGKPDHHSQKLGTFGKLRRIPIIEVGGTSFLSQVSPVESSYSSDVKCTDMQNHKPVNVNYAIDDTKPTSSPSIPIKPSHATPTSNAAAEIPYIQSTEHPQHYPVLSLPSNWFHFERELRELCGGSTGNLTNKAASYLYQIPPSKYEDLIGQNLEADFLSLILQAYQRNANATVQELAERLLFLVKLPRFDIAWMMATNADKFIVTELLQRLTTANTIQPKIIDFIRSQFI